MADPLNEAGCHLTLQELAANWCMTPNTLMPTQKKARLRQGMGETCSRYDLS